jgi:predicted small metal-binding protein
LDCGNVLETYRQRERFILPSVDTGATPIDVLGGAREVKPGRIDEGGITTLNEGHTRIANCECGAQLAGGSQEELFEAVQRHVAHHHPQLLGAMELDLVNQMAENVEGH